jgi:hypothetical protein
MTRPPIFADRAGVRSVWRFVDDRTMDIKAATAPSPVAVSEPPPIDPLADLRSQVSAMARLIAGSEPEPEWLRAGLANAVMALRFVILSEKEHPDRARLSDDLEYIGKIAPRLLSILEKRTIIAALEAAGAVELEGGHEACSDIASVVRGLTGLCSPRFELDDSRAVVQRAIEAVQLDKGNRSKGRRRHYPTPVTSPLLACAGFTAVAWKMVRGKPCPYTQTAPQTACQELWILAGGGARARSGESGNVRSWREHLAACKALSLSETAKYKKVLDHPYHRRPAGQSIQK